MTAFAGFPDELFSFFEGLAADNSKHYWTANEATWQDHVRGPMLALLDDLAAEFGSLRMFRPNRDLRFAKDRSPYKLWTGATSESRAVGGIGFYLSVSASELVIGYGAMALASDQLQRFRAAVADDASGSDFEVVLSTLEARSLPVTCGAQPPLKTSPRGFPPTHPRMELLRWKGAAAVQQHARAGWMRTPAVLDRIREVWRGARPLKDWLDEHVGATHTPARSSASSRNAPSP